jgi:hypothetical protein
MRAIAASVALGVSLALGFISVQPTIIAGASAPGQRAGSADCVTIGRPRPTATYVYQHTEPDGRATRVTNVWQSLTDTGSRLRAEGPVGVFVQVNEYHIEDDVAVLDKSSKLGPDGSVLDTTIFRPGQISEPLFRACAGQSWTIRSVTATFQSGQANASAQTPPGTLKVHAIHERVSVPAGTFDTVHYARTSQSTDDYWKSIEHGVVVKHTAALPIGTVSEVLVEIR